MMKSYDIHDIDMFISGIDSAFISTYAYTWNISLYTVMSLYLDTWLILMIECITGVEKFLYIHLIFKLNFPVNELVPIWQALTFLMN